MPEAVVLSDDGDVGAVHQPITFRPAGGRGSAPDGSKDSTVFSCEVSADVIAYNSSAVQLYMAVFMPTVLCRALRTAWHRAKCYGTLSKVSQRLRELFNAPHMTRWRLWQTPLRAREVECTVWEYATT
ncbi:hypothetical protein CGC20_3805 [Leishmania donovani]|uniref:Uncharacterized protein n=1 Tax=Leishmania donovani TaxID=5661 RepID=A0A504WXW8_LEIDO|nr:hypothetical protein CGC20_3805 [Leishmania donovani]